MSMIEELPVTAAQRPSHGWAYVPDIKPRLQPLEARKRGGRNQTTGSGGGELSAKQQKVIRTKLNELDKENYKDTHVPIPSKSKERGGRKITSNVRRILTYQRTFVHYLADEEAQLAQAGGGGSGSGNFATPTVSVPPQTPASGHSKSSRKSASKQNPMHPPPRPVSARRTNSISNVTTLTTPTSKQNDSPSLSLSTLPSPNLAPPPAAAAPPPTSTQPMDIDAPSPSLAILTSTPMTAEDEKNPLLHLQPHVKPVSARVLRTLLSEPPLSYSASRATTSQPILEEGGGGGAGGGGGNGPSPLNSLPLPHHQHQHQNYHHQFSPKIYAQPKPVRHFCTICGYWGRVRCKRCGERTCGLMDCWRSHEGICSVPAY